MDDMGTVLSRAMFSKKSQKQGKNSDFKTNTCQWF